MTHTWETFTAAGAPAGRVRASCESDALIRRNRELRLALRRRYEHAPHRAMTNYEDARANTAVHSDQCACRGAAVGSVDELYV